MTRQADVEHDTAAGRGGAAARPGDPAHRPLPDPQPGHGGRLDRPRRPRVGAARRSRSPSTPSSRSRARAAPAASPPPSSSSAPGPPPSRPTRSSARCTSRCGRAGPASRSRRSPGAAATSPSPASSPRSSSTTAGAVAALGDLVPRHGAHSGAGPHRRGRAQRQPRPTRADLDGDRTPRGHRHRSDRRRARVGRVPPARRCAPRGARPRPSPGSSTSWLSTPSTFTVNGQAHSGHAEGAQDARRLPPRGLRAHRHAPRVRARRVRRVHDPGRRRGRPLVPHVRGAGRGRRHHHHRGHRSRRRHARPGAGGVPPGPRPAVRVLHPGLRRQRARVPGGEPAPEPRRDPRGPVRATSAGAPATRGSSRRCRSRRRR